MSKYSLANLTTAVIFLTRFMTFVYQFTMLYTHNSILTSYSHYQLDITVYALDVEEKKTK